MNYRHAFHAGNHADVLKHAILTRILAHLLRKETPFRVVDTHAGIGLYDLRSEEAGRTGEWRGGIGRMGEPFGPEVEALLGPYRAVLAGVRARHGADAYPGSPLIVRETIRPGDRAIAVELHPADHAALARLLVTAPNVRALHLDGWTALGSLIPPRERRGLVLIDPPFEQPDELRRLPERLARAVRRWPTGTYQVWYPIKDLAEVAAMAGEVAALVPGALRLELLVEPAGGPPRLRGSGLIVVNPPWTLRDEAAVLLPALAARLGVDGAGRARIEGGEVDKVGGVGLTGGPGRRSTRGSA